MGRAHFGPIISQEKQWWSQKVGKVFPALRVEKIGVPFYHYSFLVIIFLLGITLCKITSINPRSIPQLIYGKIWVSVALLSFIFLQWQREAGTDVFLLMFSLSVHCFVIRWHIWSLLSYIYIYVSVSQSVQSSSLVLLIVTPWTAARPGLPVHYQLLEFIQTHIHWVSDVIQSSHPLSSPSPPTFNLPSIRIFSNESVLPIRWPKYWSISFSISPSNEHPGLISFRMDWLDLLPVQGTLKSLLQHHSSKASIS